MTNTDEAISWGIFSLVWLIMVTWKAYNAGRRKGAEEERAKSLTLAAGERGRIATQPWRER